MNIQIACEGFDQTPAIREHVESQMDHLQDFLKHDEMIRVYCAHPGPRVFSARIKIHADHREVVASEESDNLYRAITAARHTMEHRLLQLRKKHLNKRRDKSSHALELEELTT